MKQGTRATENAYKKMKATRSRMCCMAIVGIVILVLITGVVGGVLGNA